MRYFYYLKTPTEEIVYQDEDIVLPKEEKEAQIARIASKEVEEETKVELEAEISSHKLEKYDVETDTKTVVDAKDSTCLIRWDGMSPYYELIKGVAPEVMPFLGWPQVSKENYVEPVEEIIS
jgi:hypothetical protein